jgi:hypothetical protein
MRKIIRGSKYRRGILWISQEGTWEKKSVLCEEKKYTLHIYMKIVY